VIVVRVWLIRHALVHPDAMTCLYGTQDVAICDVTMAADAHRYRALARRLPAPAAWYATPLSRTQLTAEAIFEAGYPARLLRIEPGFIEQDFGEWQGVPMQEFSARMGTKKHPFWPVAAAVRPPGGESFDEMILRVGAALNRLAQEEAGDVVVVSHGGAIRAACAHALQLDPHQALSLAVDNISLTRLEWNGSGWRVISLNEQLST
jgi:broad specificity phosphatase PhoE